MRSTLRLPLVASLLLTSAVGAQVQLGQRIEEGVTDYEPSRLGLRVVHPDSREDVQFDHIYRVEGRDDLFARRDGAITAVFPRSVYYRTRRNNIEYTVIPSGTVFYIGDAPEQPYFGPPVPAPRPSRPTLAEPLSTAANGRINLSSPSLTLAAHPDQPIAPPEDAEGAQPDESETAGAAPEPPRSRTMSDEVYRRTRLRDLALKLGPGPDADADADAD